jgi:ABC-2 type transport system ATP-binding protein
MSVNPIGMDVTSISKRYGNLLALENISFQIQPGEVVGLLGPNGAGKTTAIRIITGYMAPYTGSVTIAGFDLLTNPEDAKKRIGYLPETPPLYPELTVHESLLFVSGLYDLSRKAEKIAIALEKTGITNMRNRLVGHLSKGYRQRLGIAQAILHQPPFLILDEPTVGLDPKQIIEIRELIKGLKGNVAILLSSHILQDVMAVCNRVIIIHKGRIVTDVLVKDLSAPLGKKRCLVTMSRTNDNVRSEIAKIPGVEAVEDYASDLEEVFMQVTQKQ